MDIISDCQFFRPLFSYRGYLWFCLFVRCLCLWQSRHSIARYVTWAGRTPQSAYAWLKHSQWLPDQLYDRLFEHLVRRWGTHVAGHLVIALDDTHTSKPYAKKMADLGWLFEERVAVTDDEGKTHWGVWGQLGHCWVTLALLFKTGSGWLAFPFRLAGYVRRKILEAQGEADRFQTLYQVARSLIERLPSPALIVADHFYRGGALVKGTGHHLLSRLPKSAVVYEIPPVPLKRKRGRPAEYGTQHSLREWSDDFEYTPALLSGERVEYHSRLIRLKGFGKQNIRLLVVRSLERQLPPLFLFTTLTELTPEQMMDCYAGRFSIEVAFKELKSQMGMGQYHVRSQESIHHWIALATVAYALLKVQMIEQNLPSIEAAKRRYYAQELRHKFSALAAIPLAKRKIQEALQDLELWVA